MPADRFYFEGTLQGQITLEGPEAHHLRVMRIEPGEKVQIINGKGSLGSAILLTLGKNTAILECMDVHTTPDQPPKYILGIPYMRMNHLEWVIEKGTELGADAFHLYPAEFSEQRAFSDNQMERLHNIIISALKQSGRLFLPSLEILTHLDELFATDAAILYGDPEATAPLKRAGPAIFITGPRQGFSEKEMEILKKKGQAVRLNPNILRAETAPIAAISILNS